MKQPKVITFADKVLGGIESIQPFPEVDAWRAYRLAAFGEAIGWTLLIIGIAVRSHHGYGSGVAVPVTGQIHGTLFLIYFGVLLSVYTSLRWSRVTFLVAIAAGVPPYGSLLFEQWKSHSRKNTYSRQHYRSIVLARAAGNI
jgi:integral membrane protein